MFVTTGFFSLAPFYPDDGRDRAYVARRWPAEALLQGIVLAVVKRPGAFITPRFWARARSFRIGAVRKASRCHAGHGAGALRRRAQRTTALIATPFG